MEKTDLFYIRFMDDWVILSPTRWKLRRAIVRVNQCLTELGFKKHPDKTFIGRTDRGFDFLGYHLQTIANLPKMEAILIEKGKEQELKRTKAIEKEKLEGSSKQNKIIKNPKPITSRIAKPNPKRLSSKSTQDSALKQALKTVHLSISQKTIQQFYEKIARLYEQGASTERIGQYKHCFFRCMYGVGLPLDSFFTEVY